MKSIDEFLDIVFMSELGIDGSDYNVNSKEEASAILQLVEQNTDAIAPIIMTSNNMTKLTFNIPIKTKHIQLVKDYLDFKQEVI